MHRSIASVVALSLALGAPGRAASAAVPRLVAELDDSVYDADDLPTSLLPVGGQVVFLNYSSTAESIILWASDGTTQGTRPLAELSHQYEGARGLGTLNNLAFFAARDNYVSRVWRTDGTIAGTYPLTRQLPAYNLVSVIARTLVYFIACDSPRCEVWSTDGTIEGTRQVGTVELSYMREMVALGDDAYFLADSADGKQTELWRASAQEGRIERLRTLPPSSKPDPSGLMAAGGRLFFLAPDGGRQIWTSDGTAAGTVPVTHVSPQNAWTTRLLGGYFDRAWFVANDGTKGVQLWSSDGTEAGTRRATDFGDRTPRVAAGAGRRPAPLHGLEARATPAVDDDRRLADQPAADGVPRRLSHRARPPHHHRGRPCLLLGGSDLLLYRAVDHGWHRARHDEDPPFRVRPRRRHLRHLGGRRTLLLQPGQGPWVRPVPLEQRRNRGGNGQARQQRHGPVPRRALLPAAVGGRVFFPAFDKAFTGSLWITSGRGPAAEVFSLPQLAAGSSPKPMATAEDRLLFFTCTNESCPQLWGTDSTELEPLLEDSALDDSCESYPIQWAVPAGRHVLFNAEWDCTLTQGNLLFGTDGTPRGSEEIPFPEYWCGQPPVPSTIAPSSRPASCAAPIRVEALGAATVRRQARCRSSHSPPAGQVGSSATA